MQFSEYDTTEQLRVVDATPARPHRSRCAARPCTSPPPSAGSGSAGPGATAVCLLTRTGSGLPHLVTD